MKQGWERKTLGDIAKFYRGLTYSKGDEADTSSKMVLRSNNVDLDTNSLVLEDLKCLREDFVIDDDKKVKPNTILICMSNGSKQHIGKVAYIQDEMDFAFGGFMGLIAPASNMSGKYIYYTCISSYFKHFLAGIGNGIGITNLRFSDLSSFSVPIPPIAEQEKIVAELDCLSGIIEKKKQQLKELDNLAQSIFYEMFGDPVENDKGWKVKKIGEVCIVERGGSPRPINAFITDDENGVNWIKIGDATEGSRFITSTKEKIIPEGVRKSRMVYKGDFILSNSMSFGRPYIMGIDGCIHDGWLVLRDKDNVFDKTYLYYYLGSSHVYQEFKRLAVGGVVNNLNSELVRGVRVAIPSFSVQQDFASKIESIEKQKELIANSIKETETLFNSRMDYYFN